MLKLSLNGEKIEANPNGALLELLEDQGYQSQKIAVAINGEFVPRSQYVDFVVNDGDEVDIIQAVGGG